MAHRPAVHIELQEDEWVVVREGNKRATSSHPTQSEAAENGRDLARRDNTEFFLHAQDGRIREHRDYRDEPDKGLLDQASETVEAVTGAVTGTTGAAAQALGTGGERDKTDQESGDTQADTNIETSNQDVDDTREVRGLTDAENEDASGTPEERYPDYEIYDQDSQRIGPLNELFVDENDAPEYIGVGTNSPESRSILVPVEAVTVDDRLHRMMISRPRTFVEAGPSLGHEDEVTAQVERRVRVHYGLETSQDAQGRGGYGAYYPADAVLAEPESGDYPGSGATEDEVKVQRAEEEIRVETREREAGAMRVRKRVRTDRERIEVPKKRVEVTVERVSVDEDTVPAVEGATTAPEIGEEEIVVPVIEEEIVVEKRPVVKEEIRIRKQVVEDTEVVEEDVRREEIEIDEQSRNDAVSHAEAEEDLER